MNQDPPRDFLRAVITAMLITALFIQLIIIVGEII